MLILAPLIVVLMTPPQNRPAIVVQPADELQEIVLLDGTRAVGRVERVTDESVTLRTASGATLEVARSQIVALSPVEGHEVKGEFWPSDPNPTRLLFGPTGRSLKRGRSYLALYAATMPFVQVGLTDRISIGGGTIPFFGEGTERPLWVTPKAQVFARGHTDAAVGLIHVTTLGDGGLGIAYGVVTHGTADTAATIGIGYAYAHGAGSGSAPVAMLGGEARVSRRVKLVTENYLLRTGGLLGGGVRLLGKRRSVDVALVAPLSAGFFVVFPTVNFVWAFGGPS